MDKKCILFFSRTIILFSVLFVLFGIIVIYNVVDMIRVIRAWKKNKSYRDDLRRRSPSIQDPANDNELYVRQESDVTQDGEYIKFTNKLADIRSKYANYNAQVRERSKLANQAPEDVVDRTLISNKYDNYTYTDAEGARKS